MEGLWVSNCVFGAEIWVFWGLSHGGVCWAVEFW